MGCKRRQRKITGAVMIDRAWSERRAPKFGERRTRWHFRLQRAAKRPSRGEPCATAHRNRGDPTTRGRLLVGGVIPPMAAPIHTHSFIHSLYTHTAAPSQIHMMHEKMTLSLPTPCRIRSHASTTPCPHHWSSRRFRSIESHVPPATSPASTTGPTPMCALLECVAQVWRLRLKHTP